MKNTFLTGVTLFGLLASAAYPQSQSTFTGLQPGIKFERIGTEQGFSHGRVHDAILQDWPGFMWFGTQDGLNRYDGYLFTVHKIGMSLRTLPALHAFCSTLLILQRDPRPAKEDVAQKMVLSKTQVQ
ncbi:MAG: hypothetical protein ACE5I1_28590 [bacterium]